MISSPRTLDNGTPNSPFNPSLHRFAIFTALATFLLVGFGGMVTSHDAGLAVPDWPTTYGYNMFFFPFSKWVGGIFYEHTHRLLASGVGMLTTILALWLHGRNSRLLLRRGGLVLNFMGLASAMVAPQRILDAIVLLATGLAAFGASFIWPKCEPAPKWLRQLGLIAFCMVILQGVLGGLRVTMLKDQIGIFHGIIAQLFFVLTCALALFTSRRWLQSAIASRPAASWSAPAERSGDGAFGGHGAAFGATHTLRWLFAATTCLIFFQLILGATMRHQHAGLSIPDFPLAYGRLWPAMDPNSVALYNAHRMETSGINEITAIQIALQMVHRIMALLIFVAVTCCAWLAWRRLDRRDPAFKLALAWLGLIMIQITLGAATVLSNKAADIATAHVLVGALSLATGSMLCIFAFRIPAFTRQTTFAPAGATAAAPETGPLAPRTA